jgi:hypothetical protein
MAGLACVPLPFPDRRDALKPLQRFDPPARWAGSAGRTNDEFRYQLVELAEKTEPWPFPDDLPPSVDDASLSAFLDRI